MTSLLETQRKNIDTVAKAHKMALSNLQELTQKQADILAQMVDDNAALASDLMSDGSPEDKLAKNAELMKSTYERSLKNLEEISTLINKHNTDASNLITKRVQDSMNELKDSLEKATSKAAA